MMTIENCFSLKGPYQSLAFQPYSGKRENKTKQMGDFVYIEPAGDEDDYEYYDYSPASFAGDNEGQQRQENWHQARKHSSANETISPQSNVSQKGVETSESAYIRLHGLLPNVTKNEGESLRLKCGVVGVLPIEFRWYKNDAPLLKEKNRVAVKTRDYWSRLRISRLEPLDQAFYRCEAANKAGVVKTTSLVQVKAGKYRSNLGHPPADIGRKGKADDQSLSLDGDESTFFKPFTCQDYTFEACRDYLYGQKIYIHSKNLEDIKDIDRRLRAAFMVISNSSQVSDECKEYAARAACYHSYQICDITAIPALDSVHRNGAGGSSVPIQQICKDDCERLEEDICPQEYETARSQNLIGRDKEQILPNCRDLPHDLDKCLRVVDDERKHSAGTTSCYAGNGKTYRGVTSTTLAGRRCMQWSDASLRHPVFSPSKYPELRNHNYCRNPGGKKPQPWCFAGEGVEEYCDVPKCISNDRGRAGGGIDAGVVTIPSEYMPYILLTAGILGVLLLVVLVGVICYCVRARRKRSGKGAKMANGSQPAGRAPLSASLGDTRALMNGHKPYHHSRHHHYCAGVMPNGVRKPAPNGQQLYSLLSPSTGPGLSPAPAPSSSLMDGPAEIPPANIRYMEVMGDGQFGKLWRGELTGYATTTSSSDECCEPKATQIAVKTLRDDATVRQRQDFEHEVAIKAKLRHPNIIELIGVSCMRTSSCSPSTVVPNSADLHPTAACMIFEFMMHGDLNAFLLLRSPYSPVEAVDSQRILLDHNDFLHISVQIASGMEYLSSKYYVHKDLASRNCFVFDRLTVKIADFGVFRDAYASDYYHHQWKNGPGALLPLRWMPPEAVLCGRYSEGSDVWSFGVTLWEIYSYGRQPYYGYGNAQVLDMIRQRCLPPRPDKCPSQMYSLMIECWHETPSRRPRFAELHNRLRTWAVMSAASAHSTAQSVTTGLTGASAPNFCPPPSTVRDENPSSASDRSSCCSRTSSDAGNDPAA